MKGVRRRRTQLLDDLRNRRRPWEFKEEDKDKQKVETTIYQSNIRKKYVIFRKFMGLLISSILNNNYNMVHSHELLNAF